MHVSESTGYVIRHFKEQGLKVAIQSNLKSVDYLDITLNLTNGLFQPYRKPNDEPLYVNTKSNHPPTVIKQIPAATYRRLSGLSSNKETFDKAKPLYDRALRSSGFNESLHYCKKNRTAPTERNRSRNIIWFNPPPPPAIQQKCANQRRQNLPQPNQETPPTKPKSPPRFKQELREKSVAKCRGSWVVGRGSSVEVVGVGNYHG